MPIKSKHMCPLCSALALVLLTTIGCGGRSASVSGIVTVDGSPVNQGTVTFSPTNGGMRASGDIEEDGSYTIRTNRDSGLDVGEYDVAVMSREVVVTSPEAPPMPGKYFVPRRYGKVSTSGLHYTVEKGSNEINLELSGEGLEVDNKPRPRRR